jgi:hypothetical protein
MDGMKTSGDHIIKTKGKKDLYMSNITVGRNLIISEETHGLKTLHISGDLKVGGKIINRSDGVSLKISCGNYSCNGIEGFDNVDIKQSS